MFFLNFSPDFKLAAFFDYYNDQNIDLFILPRGRNVFKFYGNSTMFYVPMLFLLDVCKCSNKITLNTNQILPDNWNCLLAAFGVSTTCFNKWETKCSKTQI